MLSPIERMIDDATGLSKTPGYDPNKKLQKPEEVLLEIADSAVHWWRNKRPASFTEKEHLENPTINTLSDSEKKIAVAVSKWVQFGGGP